MRTELEKRIRDGNRNLQEFVSYVETLATEGEAAPISYRHLQRLVSGNVAPDSISAPIRRLLEKTLHAPIETLLSPPTAPRDAPPVAALVVAIAIVTRKEGHVLLVARRQQSPNTLTRWQFPAGIVKPGESGEAVAVDETLLETGIYSVYRRYLGERVHPRTRVHCHYFLCEYQWGEVENLDPAENIRACWVPKSELNALIPRQETFPEVLREIEREPQFSAVPRLVIALSD